ncbi:MAG: trimethylamine methyltransferase family protein, partial [Halanaerobiaceae bacterium]
MSGNFKLKGPFSEDEIKILHEKTVEIMANTGVRIDDEKSLQIFSDNGCKIEGNKVYIEKEMVDEVLKQSPSSFVFKARNSQNNVKVGGGKPVLGPGLGIPFIIEDGEQRYSTFKDYKKLTKLIQSSDYFDVVGGDMVSPTDLDTASRHKDMFRAAAKYSDKCLIGVDSGRRKSQECLQMAKILLQTDELENNPCLLIL